MYIVWYRIELLAIKPFKLILVGTQTEGREFQVFFYFILFYPRTQTEGRKFQWVL